MTLGFGDLMVGWWLFVEL